MLLYYFALFVLGLFALYKYLTPKTPPNFPPGPKSYPLAGGAWIFEKITKGTDLDFTNAVMKMSEMYGPIIGINLGMMRSIIVTGYENVKEVLTRDEFQGRPEIFTNKLLWNGRKLGLIFSEGAFWREQRRFCLRHLRDFGFGKSEIEVVIHEEISKCLNSIKKKMKENADGIVKMNQVFGPAVINVLWVILSGKRNDHDDPQFLHLLELLDRSFRSGNSSDGNPIQDWPFLRHFPPFSAKFRELMDGRLGVDNMLEKEIKWHEETRDPLFSRDFIDLYLKEIEDLIEKGEAESTNFTREQLVALCNDLFSAGAESTSNSLAFAMLYMLLYPKVQAKVQEELDTVIGKRRCNYEDRVKLPYTEAVLCELTRISSIAPLTVPHSTMENTKLHGFDIPKDTFILVNLASAHFDKKYWGNDAECFRPERFLDANNKLIKTDHLMGFGFGKRVCLGELLARMNTFDFFAAMLQTFKLELVSESERPSTVPVRGFTASPQPFSAKLILR